MVAFSAGLLSFGVIVEEIWHGVSCSLRYLPWVGGLDDAIIFVLLCLKTGEIPINALCYSLIYRRQPANCMAFNLDMSGLSLRLVPRELRI